MGALSIRLNSMCCACLQIWSTLVVFRFHLTPPHTHTQVVEQESTSLGPEHPTTLTSKANWAVSLYELERFGEAEVIQRQVLEARGRVLGEHSETVRSMGHLAATLRKQGCVGEAKELEQQVQELGTSDEDDDEDDSDEEEEEGEGESGEDASEHIPGAAAAV